MTDQQEATTDQPVQVSVQRIYLKDLSFESPQSPDVFRSQFNPHVKMDLNTRHRAMEDSLHEVVLSVTLTVSSEDKPVFLCEIQQAGVFLIQGLDAPHQQRVLATFCPELLFPYMRETVDSLAVRGSFPPLMLAPVNFEALFEQTRDQQKPEGQDAAAPH